jgi:hypothetical protein
MRTPRIAWIGLVGLSLLLIVPVGLAAASPVPAFAPGHAAPSTPSRFNRAGDVLITDQFNNRVIEVDPLTQQIVWSFGSGNGSLCNPGPHAVIGPNDAERLSGGLTLIAGTGIGAGVPNTTACADNRVIVVNEAGAIVWQYGHAGQTGSGPGLLNVPVFAVQLPNHDFLITDQGNNRIIEVNLRHQVVWRYDPTSGPGVLNSPNSAQLLSNGDVLIADEGNNRILEVAQNHSIVWEYAGRLSAPASADRLPNGDTLVADSLNNRIVEISPQKHLVFQYATNTSAGSNPNSVPTCATLLTGGDLLITDQFNHRAFVIDANGSVVYQYGQTNVPGNGFDQLYGPYSAYEVGDYTGQTVPPAHFR